MFGKLFIGVILTCIFNPNQQWLSAYIAAVDEHILPRILPQTPVYLTQTNNDFPLTLLRSMSTYCHISPQCPFSSDCFHLSKAEINIWPFELNDEHTKCKGLRVLSWKQISRDLRVFGVKFWTQIFIRVKYLTFCKSAARLSYRYRLSKNTSKPVEVTYAVLLLRCL